MRGLGRRTDEHWWNTHEALTTPLVSLRRGGSGFFLQLKKCGDGQGMLEAVYSAIRELGLGS